MTHDCREKGCKPPTIMAQLLSQLNKTPLIKKSIKNLNIHQEAIQAQVIAERNYLLFREAAKTVS